MQEYNNQYSSNQNFSPKKETILLRQKPGGLAIACLVALPLLLSIMLLAIFMTVPEIQPTLPDISTKCILSAEANKTGLSKFFQQLQDVYFYELNPEWIATRPKVTTSEVREYFVPYDPSPSSIKRRTKRAEELLQDLEKIKYTENELKLRERVAYYIARNVLRNNSGWGPWGMNYYAADWMMGPDYFCVDRICSLISVLESVLPHFVPYNMSDALKLREILMKHNETAEQYIENLKTGWRTGMVRSTDGCKDGLHAIKYIAYEPITLKGAKGAWKVHYIPTVYTRLGTRLFIIKWEAGSDSPKGKVTLSLEHSSYDDVAYSLTQTTQDGGCVHPNGPKHLCGRNSIPVSHSIRKRRIGPWRII